MITYLLETNFQLLQKSPRTLPDEFCQKNIQSTVFLEETLTALLELFFTNEMTRKSSDFCDEEKG